MKAVLVLVLLLVWLPAPGRSQPLFHTAADRQAARSLHTGPISAQIAATGAEGERPDLNAGRVAGEFFTGLGVGMATGYVVALAGFASGEGFRTMFERGYWGLAVGHTVGSAAGVYLIGILGDQTGSFPKTLLGSTAGMGTALLISRFLGEEAYAFLFLPPVGAVLAFNLTRRYDTDLGVGMQISLNNRRRVRAILTSLPRP